MDSESANLLERAVALAERTGFVYLHGPDGQPVAYLIPAGGWWAAQLPSADAEHFDHEHLDVASGQMPE